MKNINEIISGYVSSYNELEKEPVKVFLDFWLCVTLISQININKHSNKNKNDKDKLDYLFKDYRNQIILIFSDKNNITCIKNILEITESGCPILITKFEDMSEQLNQIDELIDYASTKDNGYFENNAKIDKKLDYFMECLASLIHLGKNKIFKSFNMDYHISEFNYPSISSVTCAEADGIPSISATLNNSRQLQNKNNCFTKYDINFSLNAAKILFKIVSALA